MNLPAADSEAGDRLERLLEGNTPRFRVHAYQSLTSTQDRARELLRAGEPHGTVVIARAQTRGRGRLGSKWVSAANLGLYLSVVLKPKRAAAELPQLSLVVAVAAAEALVRACNVRVELKWPNDLLLKGRKLGGILGELELNSKGAPAVVLGIGLNLNQRLSDFPRELRRRAISVRQATGLKADPVEVAAAVLSALARRYGDWEKRGLATTLRRFRRLSPMVRGARVRVDAEERALSGITRGLARDGRLIVALRGDGLVRLHAAEVHLSGWQVGWQGQS